MIAIVLIIVLILLFIWYYRKENISQRITESMTKIRRGVGFANDADEIQVAAGIVHSAPIMDMTHTYWDGAKGTSCDECTDADTCPHCPNVAATKIDHFTDGEIYDADDSRGRAGIRIVDETPVRRDTSMDQDARLNWVLGTDSNPANERFDPTPVIQTDYRDFYYDLDPEYVSSRERIGACTGNRHVNNVGRMLYRGGEDFGRTESETAFDRIADHGIVSRSFDTVGKAGRNKSKKPIKAINLLYNDVMALENSPPTAEPCQYFGHNGYSYKEPCWR